MNIKLPSGKEIYANHGILGITPKGHEVNGCILTNGYDSPIDLNEWNDEANDYIPAFTANELIDLANIAIARWIEFRTVKYIFLWSARFFSAVKS